MKRITLLIAFALAGVVLGSAQVPKLTETYRHYCFDFNWVDKLDRQGKALSDYSKMSAADHVKHLVEMKANSLMVFCMSISGYMFYDSEVGQRHPSLDYDYLKEIIQLGHKEGIAMELYVPTMWADWLVQQHPSWGIRDSNGDLYTRFFGGYHPDLNSPAADWYVDVLRELIPAYGGDAFFADGISFMRYGQSEFTVKKFREEMGRDYPKSLSEDPDWRATLRWEVAQVEKFWRRLRDTIKELDPRVEVTFNGPGPLIQMPGSGGWGFVPVPPHVDQLTDYVFTEAGSSGEYATWTRGIAHPKPFKVTFLNRHSILDPFDPDEIRARIGRTLAVGGQPYRYDRTSVDGEANRHFTDTWKPIFTETQQKEPYVVGAEPVKYVAVVSSEPTMLYRGRSDPSSHANDLVGCLKTLDALHIQHDVVADWNVRAEFLEPYQLVILPNVGCMRDKEIEAVREYVRKGGSVLATAETSLLDESGTPREDFGLADVLGLRVDERPSNEVQTADAKKPVYIHPGRDPHEILKGLPSTELIFPGDSTYARAVSGRPTARLIADAGTPMNAPGAETGRTAIQVNEFGRGKVVYVSNSLFARTMHHSGTTTHLLAPQDGVHWVDQLIVNVVEYLAPRPIWRLQGPASLWAGLNAQPREKRHVLHLVNWRTDQPARDIEVTLAKDAGVGRNAMMIWPEKERIAGNSRSGSMVYKVPQVGPHVMIVFED